MKKLLAVILVLFMLIPCAIAEDYSSYTTEDLHRIVDAARNELEKRELIADNNLLIFDDQNVQIYMTGNGRQWEYSGTNYFDLELIVINNTENDIYIDFENLSINGWNVPSGNFPQTTAGKKKKDKITLSLTAANIQNYSEIEDMEAVVAISVRFTQVYASDPITIHFDW